MTSPAPTLKAHVLSELFPRMSLEDFNELIEDIKKNGLQQPIVLYQDQIVDGVHRYQACLRAGRDLKFTDFKGTDAEAKAFVISANFHRRHLTAEQKRELIKLLVKTDPTKSDRQIALAAKVDHKTVGVVRADLEATGDIPQSESTTGADGKARKRKVGKPKSVSSAKSKKETITYREVVDAKTATNAYSVLEEHLLDALQEIKDFSSFDHADEKAQATIEKLQEKLSGMQPHEAAAA